MKEVVEGLRKKQREVPGIAAYMQPIQNLQLGGRQSKAQYQYILQSVKADELNDWASRLQEPMRADPMFRDVTSVPLSKSSSDHSSMPTSAAYMQQLSASSRIARICSSACW